MAGQKKKNQAHPPLPGVCGIDEAGRGPLAGPVMAAAVVLPPDLDAPGLADSKTLAPRRRERLRELLIAGGAWIGRGLAWPEEIDRLNIHQATLLAMGRAWEDLVAVLEGVPRAESPEVAEILVDGLYLPPERALLRGTPVSARAVTGGDGLHREIMAASIIAKTERDAWMRNYHARDPRYGFDRHKGYPTRDHKEALLRHGPCPIHRRTFRGVQT
ncbi:ribonuclease HII [Alkalispirochaeta sphaeroplastigenens]|uniref:Ribonuclease n=1 Tax=Alkalispirochaeta sphaeroplastigenens TaxID=1187066 RepID=A0A2S4JYR3_9SPIO|nr:ribonuclease HII [Alkalispirochaeta sphaeroplastigenens]POR04667.1 ribonuclease HII [Alkalispirochaeta sphaeroplastigenens]